MSETTPRLTPLADVHRGLGAHMTDFAGWMMPLHYGSALGEHAVVRKAAGMFDLTHMGEIEVSGPDAGALLDHLLASKISAIRVGKAKYSVLGTEDGGIVDDLISYRLADDQFLVVPNAANTDVVWSHFEQAAAGFDVSVRNQTLRTALIAVQGPRTVEVLSGLVNEQQRPALVEMGYYACAPITVAGIEALVARTGYTGEDGFELFVAWDQAAALWAACAEAGEPFGLAPVGLAARDTLRLEAGMPLYGHELGLDTSPFAAGIGRIVALKTKDSFVGRDAFAASQAAYADEATAAALPQLVGLEGQGRRAARQGYPVFDGDEQVGAVTSGLLSPTLGHPIAMAYVPGRCAEPGTHLTVDVRGQRLPFRVSVLPFYSRLHA